LFNRANGNVTLEFLVNNFNAQFHPDVVKKIRTEKDIFKEFATAWGIQNSTTPIDFNEFYGYYSDISSCIPKDEDFEKVLRAVWRH